MKMARKSKLISKALALLSLTTLISSCSNVNIVEHRYIDFNTELFFQYDGEKEFADTLVSPLNKLSDLFDTYKEVSKLVNAYSINHANDFLEVDSDLYKILSLSDDYFQDTDGLFNVLVKDLSELWKTSINNNTLPTEEETKVLVDSISSSSLEFKDGNRVKIKGNAHIDLGAIAKGYALAKVKEQIKKTEITNYIFNAGFSSIILGENSENDGLYRVGINNSSNKYIEVKNTSIGTSSIYEQGYINTGDKIYSHIVNPLTGDSCVKHHMVVAIHDDPILTDVYSTVGMISSLSQIKIFETISQVKFITFSDGEVTYSSPDLKVLSR